MHSKLAILAGIVGLSVLSSLAWAAVQATPDEAKAMAIKAADYLKSVGPEKAFAAFNQTTGPWHNGDLYVTAQDNHGVMVANGSNPGLVGRSVLNLRDVTGKPFNQDIQAITTDGWVSYQWQDPLSKEVKPKKAYEIRVGNYIVGVGAYAN